jgi:MFS transporter, UMF1 family
MDISIPVVEVKNREKKIINSWAFYDWANSAYPLVITSAIFPIFYENITTTRVGEEVFDTVVLFGNKFHNTELYSYVIAISFLVVSFTSPILSGIADYTGSKKRFMQFFCYMGAFSCASLYFFTPDHLALGLISVMLASIGFWGSLVFYNAFLPEIAPSEKHDRISAKGYSLGYLGSSILLILNLVFIMNYEYFGFKNSLQPVRYSFLTVGLWWIGFSQITFSSLPANSHNKNVNGNIFTKGYLELKKVWFELKETPRLKRFLQAFFVYSMGIQTVMLMAVLFGKKEIKGMEDSNLIISVLIIQFIGIGGAYLFSFFSSKLGNIKALIIAVFIWICLCTGTYLFVYEPSHFYFAAAVVGLIMGGIQSLSRSTYAKMLPDTNDHASYFSFYEVTEKTAIVIGMFSFGFIEGMTGSMRNSIFALIIFFIIGIILLSRVPAYKNIKPVEFI